MGGRSGRHTATISFGLRNTLHFSFSAFPNTMFARLSRLGSFNPLQFMLAKGNRDGERRGREKRIPQIDPTTFGGDLLQ